MFICVSSDSRSQNRYQNRNQYCAISTVSLTGSSGTLYERKTLFPKGPTKNPSSAIFQESHTSSPLDGSCSRLSQCSLQIPNMTVMIILFSKRYTDTRVSQIGVNISPPFFSTAICHAVQVVKLNSSFLQGQKSCF